MRLRTHAITLHGKRITLRPMTEEDWPILLQWNSDPEVLYFSEGDDVQAYTLEQIQEIYRGVSQKAFCFIAEVNRQPIRECWLQEMNLPYIFRILRPIVSQVQITWLIGLLHGLTRSYWVTWRS